MSDKDHVRAVDMVQAGRNLRGMFPFTIFAKLNDYKNTLRKIKEIILI